MALSANHEHGAFFISRSLFESDIWAKPADYAKIWIYLIGRANHKEAKYRGFTLKRGQCFCTAKELTEQITYYVGYRPKKISESKVKHCLKFLRDTQRITTTKEPRGMVITILNYDLYQSLENYGRTKESSSERTNVEPVSNQKPLSINNKEKKEIKENYKVVREKLIWHIAENYPRVANPERYVCTLEEATSTEAVSKALREWNNGGLQTLTDFWNRAKDLHKKTLSNPPSTPPEEC